MDFIKTKIPANKVITSEKDRLVKRFCDVFNNWR